jgi:cell division protein FtsB
MAKVKPMRVTAPRIVQPNDRGRGWLWALLLLVLGLWSWQVFEFGRKQAGFSVTQSNAREQELEARIAVLEVERDALRAAAARFERAGQIDRAAADGVQEQVKGLQDERAELKREVAFLKTLVSGVDHKLKLAGDKLVAVGEDAYRFEVTLSKSSGAAGTVEGEARFEVKGRLEGAEKTLDMKTLTDGRRSRIGVRFKNYQKLGAELKLPEGFDPSEIVVAISPKGKDFKAFEKSFDWQVPGA